MVKQPTMKELEHTYFLKTPDKNTWHVLAWFMNLLADAMHELARILRLTPAYARMLALANLRGRADIHYDYTSVNSKLSWARQFHVKSIGIECFTVGYRDALRKHLITQGYSVSIKGLEMTISKEK